MHYKTRRCLQQFIYATFQLASAGLPHSPDHRTSNRDTRPLRRTFSPPPSPPPLQKDLRKYEKQNAENVFFDSQSNFLIILHSFLHFDISTPYYHSMSRQWDIPPPPPHLQPDRISSPSSEATLIVFLLLSVLQSLFLQKNCAFYVTEACCSL